MWIVVLTGVFSVLTLLVKAAVDTGTKTTRRRRVITADLELLGKVREHMPNASGAQDLEDRIDRHLIEFALSDVDVPESQPAESKSDGVQRLKTTTAGDLWAVISLVVALASGVAASGVLNWITDATDKMDGSTWAAVAGVGAAVLGVSVTLLTASRFKKTEISAERYELLLKFTRDGHAD